MLTIVSPGQKRLDDYREIMGEEAYQEVMDLDRPPAEGEWSPRQVPEHIIEVHGSYAERIQDAL